MCYAQPSTKSCFSTLPPLAFVVPCVGWQGTRLPVQLGRQETLCPVECASRWGDVM